ncbi:MAG TPA: hypothetical protein VF546_13955 [Pyrinomonadaceae bacterium]|jgi:hypothetical protein
MGHGNNERAQTQQQYNQAYTNANTESQYEKMRRERAERFNAFAAGGDYRQLPNEFKVFTNWADPAERKARLSVLANTRGQGVSALGAGANPTVLALDKEHRDDIAERDQALSYQTTLSDLARLNYGEQADLQSADTARRLNILGVTAERANQVGNRPRWWQTLLQAGGQAGAGLLGNPALFAAKGGRITPEMARRGQPVVVGEVGPEPVVGDDGEVQIVGQQGPELRRANAPGVVVPHYVAAGTEPRPEELPTGGAQISAAGKSAPERPGLETSAEVGGEQPTRYPVRRVPDSYTEATNPGLGDAALAGVEAPALPQQPTATRRATHTNSKLASVVKTAFQMGLMGLARGGLAGGIGAAAAGAIGGAVDDSLDERLGYARRLAGQRQRDEFEYERQKREGELRGQDLKNRLTRAQTEYYEARPDLEQQRINAQGARSEQQRVLSNLKLYKTLDPNNPQHAALLRRAADAGLEVDVEGFNAAHENLVAVDVIDPDRPTQKVRKYLDKTTGRLTDAVGATAYVQPVGPDGLTEAQRRGDADRDAMRGLIERQGAERIEQGKERIGIAREGLGLRGQPTAANVNSRLAAGAALVNKIEEEKAKAASPPLYMPGKDGQNEPTTQAWRDSYSARHKQAALRYRDQLQTGYGDLFEAGQDAEGWPYGKPKVQPATGGARGAAPAPRGRLRQANVEAAVKSLVEQKIVKDEADARRYIADHYEVIP